LVQLKKIARNINVFVLTVHKVGNFVAVVMTKIDHNLPSFSFLRLSSLRICCIGSSISCLLYFSALIKKKYSKINHFIFTSRLSHNKFYKISYCHLYGGT